MIKINKIARMYESEILKFNSNEFKTLSFLRAQAGENRVIFYSKEQLGNILKLDENEIDTALKSLKNSEAIVMFNIKDNESKINVANAYYLREYDTKNQMYMSANTIDEIRNYALEIIQAKELQNEIKNNSNPRQLIIE
ncbi:hypothetical protein HYI19_17970 [Clostridium botulinum]|uniref:hypothetical protein n=1 Tax=Clostridium botulinum TaxID=1491 RepID=UPI001C9A39E0|nr:hypothetical protein [Clostridium botulinum]MBY6846682.1 hypothetical protein [Clostridium botulinum]